MSTQIMIKNWQPAPTKNLVNGIPVKKRQKLSQTNAMNSHSSWEDVRGLAWVFSEDDWS